MLYFRIAIYVYKFLSTQIIMIKRQRKCANIRKKDKDSVKMTLMINDVDNANLFIIK
jgi:hypothetical protein